ncbi:hypothetical protein E4U49_007850 [Claviceps purpurea]|nr:hypothetical protein E4U49_007850 [Claviceps purpurea]
MDAHCKSTGKSTHVHWLQILGVFDDVADCEADGGWVTGGDITLRTRRSIGFRGFGVGVAISVALGRLAVNL